LDNIFIGRQPILDKNENIFGYELLFRDSLENRAVFENKMHAMCRLLANVFENFGVDILIGNAKGFVNINEEMLFNNLIELIPSDKFILEILEDSNIDDNFIDNVKKLKILGYTFALDDFIFEERYLKKFGKLIPIVDYIKIDLPSSKKEILDMQINKLKKYNVKLIAEKVEEKEDYEYCKEIGFDYFQGYYFAKPDILEQKNIDPSKIAVIKITNMLRKDASINKIVEAFNINPDISYNLLRFINSANFFFRSNIKSIRHAISLIGYRKLQNWLFLLSYAKPGRLNKDTALLQTAVVRAKTMEILAEHKWGNAYADSAFLTGMLSLVDNLFRLPKEKLVMELDIAPEIKNAILFYEGKLGEMLMLVVHAEHSNIAEMEKYLKICNISLNEFNSAQNESFLWYQKLIKDL
jgi:EAL and modified HD-GYP domain-containing signal transduction protein